jgi:hypothetical protein
LVGPPNFHPEPNPRIDRVPGVHLLTLFPRTYRR